MRCDSRSIVLAAIVILGVACPANVLAVDYSEAVDGDLSGNPALPTSLGTLSIGANSLAASFGSGDYDLFTFTIDAGHRLDSIVLSTYGGASLSFSGLASGPVWTTGLGGGVEATNLLGWTHIGNFVLGTDILDNYSAGVGAIGFTPPLLAGDYTVLLQETAFEVLPASLTFNVVPEPSSFVLAALGLIGLAASRWRRKRS